MAYNFELGKTASSSEQLCIFRTSIIINNDLLNQIAKLIEKQQEWAGWEPFDSFFPLILFL